MSNTVILIVVVSNMILTPLIQYILASRCSEIDCLCIHCKREPVDINMKDIKNINSNPNNCNNTNNKIVI